MKTNLNYIFNEEDGQGLAEYALIIVLIALAVVFSVNGFGSTLSEKYNTIMAAINLL